MPDENGQSGEPEKTEDKGDGAPIQAVPVVPAAPPPETKLPIQFNQQVNVYQIPQNAWDRLSPQQTMELTKLVLEQADATDKRHFSYAMNQAKLDNDGRKLSIKIGGSHCGSGIPRFFGSSDVWSRIGGRVHFSPSCHDPCGYRR
jgi:hypothetical protein